MRASTRRISSRLRAAIRRMTFGAELLQGLASVGHATRGLLYLLLGMLTEVAALSERRPPDLGGAFSTIRDLPGGWLLLLAVALGLFGYAVWRLLQSLLDLSGHGLDVKGLIRRSSMLMEALTYGGLAILAAISALAGSEMGLRAQQDRTLVVIWVSRVLDWPFGHGILAAVGLGAIALGASQVLKARRTAFEDIDASASAMTVIRLVGRIGLAAKGTIFGAIGILVLVATLRAEASAAGGMRAALVALSAIPFGDWLLLAVSFGLVLYGLFCLIKAWCHKPVEL